MDYIEKLELQTEEVEEVENLEKHTIINSDPITVDEYIGHTREFLVIDGDYNDGFNQLGETNGLGISCLVSKEVKEARKDVNGNVHEKLKDRIDSEVEYLNSSLDNMKFYVTPDMFQDTGERNDDYLIKKAIEYGRDNNVEVRLKRTYVTTEPIMLYNNTHLIGSKINDEYKSKVIIKNTTTDMIALYNNNVRGYVLSGITFEGSSNKTTSFISSRVIGENHGYHYWGEISGCGIICFDNIFLNQELIGMKIQNVFFNAINRVGVTVGSDNMFNNLFINADAKSNYNYIWELYSMKISNFSNIFFTGCLTIGSSCKNILKISHDSNGNHFANCWFDYVDESAVVLEKNYIGEYEVFGDYNTFIGNVFRGCARKEGSSVIKLNGVKGNVFIGNKFVKKHQGEEMHNNSYVFGFYGATKNIVINNNTYQVKFSYSTFPTESNNIVIDEPTIKKYITHKNKEMFDNYSINTGSPNVEPGRTVKYQINQSIIQDIKYTDDLYVNVTSGFNQYYRYEARPINGVVNIFVTNIGSTTTQLAPFTVEVTIKRN